VKFFVSSGPTKSREVHASDVESAAKKFIVEGRPGWLGRTILVKNKRGEIPEKNDWLVDTGHVLKKIGMMSDGREPGYVARKVRTR